MLLVGKDGEMAKFCMHCGQALEPGAKFCDNCGAKIVDDQSFIGEATSSEVVTGDGPDAADATDEIADTTDDSGFFCYYYSRDK